MPASAAAASKLRRVLEPGSLSTIGRPSSSASRMPLRRAQEWPLGTKASSRWRAAGTACSRRSAGTSATTATSLRRSNSRRSTSLELPIDSDTRTPG